CASSPASSGRERSSERARICWPWGAGRPERRAILTPRRRGVDAEDIINGIVRGALSSRGKPYGHTHRALGGLLNARNILTAAGLAWGIYEAVAGQPAGAQSSPSKTLPLPSPETAPLRRPDGLSEYVVRLVRLTISAARADGDLSLEERGAILEHARKVG